MVTEKIAWKKNSLAIFKRICANTKWDKKYNKPGAIIYTCLFYAMKIYYKEQKQSKIYDAFEHKYAHNDGEKDFYKLPGV
jgi:hypothetical protein